MAAGLIAIGILTGGESPQWVYREGFTSHLERRGPGRYEVRFERSEKNLNYIAVGGAESPHGVGAALKTISGFEVRTRASGGLSDASEIGVVVIGDAPRP